MLSQMMPLPWVYVFFMIFFCLFSFSLFYNYIFYSLNPFVTKVKKKIIMIPW